MKIAPLEGVLFVFIVFARHTHTKPRNLKLATKKRKQINRLQINFAAVDPYKC